MGRERESDLQPMSSSLLNERSPGQSSGVIQQGGGRGKLDDWSTGSLHQKGHHALEKFEGEF